MKKNFFLLLIILLPKVVFSTDLNSAEISHPSKTFSFFFENDAFFDTDREYSNGIRLSMTYSNLPPNYYKVQNFLEKIGRFTKISDGDSTQAYSLSIGQNIYTPENTQTKELVKDERPYAGLTYIGTGIISATETTMKTLEFSTGIIGPLSLAEKTQKTIHETFGWQEPMGWDNQLSNEPFIEIVFSKRWKKKNISNNGFGFDLIPEMGAGIGNALVYLQTGINFRVGYNIPNDFGTPRIRPATDTNFPLDKTDPRFYPKYKRLGLYLFCSADALYVPRNIFLDGNTFKNSHSVKRNPVIGSTIAGLGVIIHRFNIIYGHVFNTKVYETEKDRQYYGTISVSYTW
ncbi:MAG: lipid A deacylase LpxR family protein [Desulforegulaceae bacterium]|nr:lipid A deacylase LpxR family protein [Desulforegulaceae bacterium]